MLSYLTFILEIYEIMFPKCLKNKKEESTWTWVIIIESDNSQIKLDKEITLSRSKSVDQDSFFCVRFQGFLALYLI